MRILILAATILVGLSFQSGNASAAGFMVAKPNLSSDANYVLKVHKRCTRGGYRTTCDPHMRKYFFPPRQFRATRCGYNEYIRLGKRKYSKRTYRCWRRKPGYYKRDRHAW